MPQRSQLFSSISRSLFRLVGLMDPRARLQFFGLGSWNPANNIEERERWPCWDSMMTGAGQSWRRNAWGWGQVQHRILEIVQVFWCPLSMYPCVCSLQQGWLGTSGANQLAVFLKDISSFSEESEGRFLGCTLSLSTGERFSVITFSSISQESPLVWPWPECLKKLWNEDMMGGKGGKHIKRIKRHPGQHSGGSLV